MSNRGNKSPIDILYELTPCVLLTMAHNSVYLLWRRNWIKIVIVFILLVFCFWSVNYLPSGDRSSKVSHHLKPADKVINLLHGNRNENLPGDVDHPAFAQKLKQISKKQLKRLLHQETCPACFGKDMCSDFSQPEIIQLQAVNSAESRPPKTVKFGRLWDQPIAIKKLASSSVFQRFDEFLCAKTSEKWDCNVSQAIHALPFAKKPLAVKILRESHIAADRQHKNLHLFLQCANDKLIEKFETLYDINHSGDLDTIEKLNLYTTLVINPEPVLLQFFKTSHTQSIPWPFPRYKGACGRAVVVEHGGKPLHHYLKEDWMTRIHLTVQLIDLIDMFKENNPDFIVFYNNFSIENFVVQGHGTVTVIDLSEIILLKKSSMQHEKSTSMCNTDCFDKIIDEIASAETDTDISESCTQLSIQADYMYSLLCNQILSDDPRFTSKKTGPHTRGLLHDPPNDKTKINELLNECMEETTTNGRRKAAQDLKELLSNDIHPGP